MSYTIRKLSINDYSKEYFNLLSQLTDAPIISYDDFNNFISNLSDNHQVYIIIDNSLNNIVGTGTILIETKLIHSFSKVAHIEDIVTDIIYRNKGLGKMLINHLIDIAYANKYYKIILDCSLENKDFYSKCGFISKNIQMSKYTNELCS